jgi:hypothetical protein
MKFKQQIADIADAMLGSIESVIQTRDLIYMKDIQRLTFELTALSQGAIKMPEYGTWVKIEDGNILDCNIMVDESPETDEDGKLVWGEVTAPEHQEFLDAVNVLFGTEYKHEDFAGR